LTLLTASDGPHVPVPFTPDKTVLCPLGLYIRSMLDGVQGHAGRVGEKEVFRFNHEFRSNSY